MEPLQLAAIVVGGVLAVCGAITTVGNAAEKIVKVIRAAKAPDEAQNTRITNLEEWRVGVDRKLDNDKKRLDGKDSGDRVTQLALLALLDHGIDGNNIDQMQKAKEELQQHLINR